LVPVTVQVVSAAVPASVLAGPAAATAETFANVIPPVPVAATVPPSGVTRVQVEVGVAARCNEFWPAPPSKVTGAAIVPAPGATVRASVPEPPVTFTAVTVRAGRLAAVPLTVTVMSVPADPTDTAWSAGSVNCCPTNDPSRNMPACLFSSCTAPSCHVLTACSA